MRINELRYNGPLQWSPALLPTPSEICVKKKNWKVIIVIITKYHPRITKEINIGELHSYFF